MTRTKVAKDLGVNINQVSKWTNNSCSGKRLLMNLAIEKLPEDYHSLHQPFYAKLQTKVVEEICAKAPGLLEK